MSEQFTVVYFRPCNNGIEQIYFRDFSRGEIFPPELGLNDKLVLGCSLYF